MWKKTLFILLTIFLLTNSAFAVYRSTENELWEPVSQGLLDFGRMAIGVNAISWENIRKGRANRYKVVMTKKNEWLIEFTEEPYPKFGNVVCRCIRFRLRYSRLLPYQVSLQAEFYGSEQNPFVEGDTFSISGSYLISKEK